MVLFSDKGLKMAEDPEGLFLDWEVESSISSELKREKQLSAPQRRYYNLCRRKVS